MHLISSALEDVEAYTSFFIFIFFCLSIYFVLGNGRGNLGCLILRGGMEDGILGMGER